MIPKKSFQPGTHRDTLAVRVFQLTSESMWQQAALPALAIVLVGLLPVALLVMQTERRPSSRTPS